MLEFDRLQEDIVSLPEDAQQMVIDFVRLLRQRHQTSKTASPQPLSFDEQPFVGTKKAIASQYGLSVSGIVYVVLTKLNIILKTLLGLNLTR
ncbi:MAG: hypothetical protein F6J86_37515 [Symploca sp. SIO1B1]|nr:hypothetical protein [Symploca sp. SIO1B1]